MENQEHEKGKIPSKKGSLGDAQTPDPFAAHDEPIMSDEDFDARQRAIGQRRKYAGPVSKEDADDRSLADEQDDIPPTECQEPPASTESV